MRQAYPCLEWYLCPWLSCLRFTQYYKLAIMMAIYACELTPSYDVRLAGSGILRIPCSQPQPKPQDCHSYRPPLFGCYQRTFPVFDEAKNPTCGYPHLPWAIKTVHRPRDMDAQRPCQVSSRTYCNILFPFPAPDFSTEHTVKPTMG